MKSEPLSWSGLLSSSRVVSPGKNIEKYCPLQRWQLYNFLYNFSYLMTPCSEKWCFVRVGIAGQTAWAHTQAYKPDTQLKKNTQPSNKSVHCSVNGVFSCATAAPLLRGWCCRCTAVKTAKRVWDRADAACDSCLSLFCRFFKTDAHLTLPQTCCRDPGVRWKKIKWRMINKKTRTGRAGPLI